ncbi:hypothetical protein Slin15195_G065540 [Septoria linicola]|uniref:Uncharacterized protein n=1 Tax=Septoria linicola TaxID=215465 RepID=A0A9Q9EJP4_9PEZI|nr:hypothetical protein Slin14017_G115880 [Septoria linicola]USW53235.1 hypothetical protein Slin15195_G065540 [Septoria linicola]
MDSPTWEEIFGPSLKHSSNQSKPDHFSEVISRIRSVSVELRSIRNRLIEDDHLSRIDAPVAKHIREAQIISRNAEAMLKAVEQVLKENIAKRIEEENKVQWPWPDVKLAKVKPVVPPRPTARSRAEFRRSVSNAETGARSENLRRIGRRLEESPRPIGVTAVQRALANEKALRSSGKPDRSIKGIAPSNTHSEKDQPHTPLHVPKHMKRDQSHHTTSSPARSISSKYSQSTSSIHQPSLRSSTSTGVPDDTPIAWPWPASMVQAASGRSSGSFSAGYSASARTSASSES